MLFRLLCLLVVTSLLACSSPQKRLAKGDYDGAYKRALRSLEGNNKKSQDRTTLETALSEIIIREWKSLEALRNTGEADQLEKSLKKSKKLQEKIEKAKPYLNATFDQDLENIQAADENTREELYYAYLRFGKEDLTKAISDGNKFLAQDAHGFFAKAKQYDREEAPLDSLMDACYKYGVLVYNVEANASFDLTMNWEISRIFDNVTSEGNDFLKIYYDKSMSGVDCDIEVDFRNLDFDEYEEYTTETFTREIEDGYITEIDTFGNEIEIPIYTTIEGSVRIITKRRVGTWEARVDVDTRSSNCRLSDEIFRASRESRVEHYELSGDEAAIPNEYKVAFPEDLEDEDDLAEEMLEDIYADFVRYYF